MCCYNNRINISRCAARKKGGSAPSIAMCVRVGRLTTSWPPIATAGSGHAILHANMCMYRVGMVVGYFSWVDLFLDIPLSAKICLGRWEFGRIGCAAGQDAGKSK